MSDSGKTLPTLTVPQLFSLAKQTIIVVGGGRGIGASTALGALEAGADVCVIDALPQPDKGDWPPLEAAASKNGSKLSYNIADVTVEKSITDAFTAVFGQINNSSKPLSGMVVTAGIAMPVGGLDTTMDIWQKVYDINVKGSFLCCQIFAKEWIKRNPKFDSSDMDQPTASVILTSSIHGQGFNRQVPSPSYGSGKAAVKHLARVLGAEWGTKGIRFNSISPGFVATAGANKYKVEWPEYVDNHAKYTAIKRVSDPAEFKAPVVFLLSQASSFVTATDLLVDGGYMSV